MLSSVGTATGGRVAVAGSLGYLARSSLHRPSQAELRSKLRDTANAFSDSDDPALTEVGCCGVLFAGDNVSVSTALLPAAVRKRKAVRAKLQRLRDGSVLNEDSSVCFMFACCARGANMHREANFESGVFREVFPWTRLVGLFANGEICHEFLPGAKEEEAESRPAKRRRGAQSEARRPFRPEAIVQHTFSTVFMLVSFDVKGRRAR